MITQRSGTTANWSDTYTPGSLGQWKSLYQVWAAIDFGLIIILLGILTAAIIIRTRGMKRSLVLFTPLAVSLITYTISVFMAAIITCTYLTDTTVKLALQLVFILEELTYLFALCTIILLFYRFINHFQERSTGRVSDFLMLFHGGIFGLMGVICVAELALYIGFTVKTSDGTQRWRLSWHWVQSARKIAFWLVSFEIAIWAAAVVVRTSKIDRQARPCALSFLLASIGFFAMNLMWAIITIQWDIIAYLGYDSSYPRWIYYFETVFPFICIVVTYLGILVCCARFGGLKDTDIFPTETQSAFPVMTCQNPYTNPSEMESRPMITEVDPSRQFWEAESQPIHEADADYRIRSQKP